MEKLILEKPTTTILSSGMPRKTKLLLIAGGILCLLFWGILIPNMGPAQIYPKLAVVCLYVFWLFKALRSSGISPKMIFSRFAIGTLALFLVYWLIYIGILAVATFAGIFGGKS